MTDELPSGLQMRFRNVTFDTSVFPADALVLRLRGMGIEPEIVTVSRREALGTSFMDGICDCTSIPESAVWGEFTWGTAIWAGAATDHRLRAILAIISNGAHPWCRRAKSNSKGELNQLRDALILEAHARDGGDLFVTMDLRAFINDGRREKLQVALNTAIMTPDELLAHLDTCTEGVRVSDTDCEV